jgi:hypothetical protein
MFCSVVVSFGRTEKKSRVYLEVFSIRLVSGHLGNLAHGVDAHNALESQVRLQRQPARKIIG